MDRQAAEWAKYARRLPSLEERRARRAAEGREPTPEQRAEIQAEWGRSYEELQQLGEKRREGADEDDGLGDKSSDRSENKDQGSTESTDPLDRTNPFDERNFVDDRRRYNPEQHRWLWENRPGDLPDAERTKVWGSLVDGEGRRLWEQPQSSAEVGPLGRRLTAQELDVPHRSRLTGHVEAHAASWMREHSLRYAELYIDTAVCPYDRPQRFSRGVYCDDALPRMLPADSSLVVYGPNGFCKRYDSLGGDQEGRP